MFQRIIKARMLICSMYDNILSVKAPFIMDLFSIVEEVVEIYSQRIDDISQNSLDERIKNEITKNYLERMTYDSLKMSYKTFLKLLFITTDKDCRKKCLWIICICLRYDRSYKEKWV